LGQARKGWKNLREWNMQYSSHCEVQEEEEEEERRRRGQGRIR